jgi:hypothetical protein
MASLLLTLADVRDVFVILYGIVGIFMFLLVGIGTFVLIMQVKKLVQKVNLMTDETVRPTLASIREAAEVITGTTEFVGGTTIRPVVKAYGIFAGMKRAASVASSFGGRKGK